MPTNGKAVPPQRDWRDLAEQASKETDPEKLARIVEELCGALDLRAAQRQVKPIHKKDDASPGEGVD